MSPSPAAGRMDFGGVAPVVSTVAVPVSTNASRAPRQTRYAPRSRSTDQRGLSRTRWSISMPVAVPVTPSAPEPATLRGFGVRLPGLRAADRG